MTSEEYQTTCHTPLQNAYKHSAAEYLSQYFSFTLGYIPSVVVILRSRFKLQLTEIRCISTSHVGQRTATTKYKGRSFKHGLRLHPVAVGLQYVISRGSRSRRRNRRRRRTSRARPNGAVSVVHRSFFHTMSRNFYSLPC
jgi:hypothetical protein